MSETALAATELAEKSQPGAIDLDSSPLEAATFDARYEARGALGEGGMGEVRLCRDRRIGREVAVKIIRREHGDNGAMIRRFEREARVQAQLEHPSIVPVYEIGLDENGQRFFSMKRVRGLSLDRIIAAGTTSTRKLLSAFSSVCLAIAFAHARGVVHRDLKPSNVMLGEFGEVNVLDWGIAKVSSVADEEVSGAPIDHARTAVGSVLGTPGYMAPEQARGEEVDDRADVYALGAVLFEILAGEPLHAGRTTAALIASSLQPANARPSARGHDVAPELEELCVRATAFERADRPSARELSRAIERFLDGDRDAERRRVLAEEHALRAAAAAADEDLGARTRALREVNQALALDPAHEGAMRTMVELLVHPPEKLPPEAEAELAESTEEKLRSGAREASIGYATWWLIGPLFILLGIREWSRFLTLGVLCLVAAGAAFMLSRSRPVSVLRFIGAVATSAVLVATSRELFGSHVLTPAIATASTLLWVTNTGRNRARRAVVVVAGALIVIAPPLLEWLGWLPRTTLLGQHTITITPSLVEFPRATLLFVTLAHLSVIGLSSIMASRVADALALAERKLYAQTWQLRQMVPEAARSDR